MLIFFFAVLFLVGKLLSSYIYYKNASILINLVNPGAKERLVQITGPGEDKIKWVYFACIITLILILINAFKSYAKQLIEDTIRRNASPVRLDATQGGSCSSLASSASDEAIPRANRNSMNASGGGSSGCVSNNHNNNNNLMNSNSLSNNNNNNSNINNFNVPNQSIYNNNSGISGLNLKMPRGGQALLHSLSTNDASLGEYKYTVGVGQHNVKITGDCFELVRVSRIF